MKKKSITIFIISLFFISILFTISICISKAENHVNKNMIFVDDDNIYGPWEGTLDFPYKFIQDGIDNANKDDVVFVFGGIYYENLVINKSIKIVGDNNSCTILDGSYYDFVIEINEEYVQIINLSIRNSGGYLNNAGILLKSDNNLIINCIFYRTKTGIYIDGSNDNKIDKCIFYKNGEGVFLKSSKENNVKNCYFFHNGIGFNIQNSEKTNLMDCYANTNGIAFFIKNSNNIESIRCAAYNNNDNQGGFFLSDCDNIEIFNCNICHNGFGVRILNSMYIEISNCNFFHNTHNAVNIVKNSKDILIEKCEFFENLRYAIVTSESTSLINNNNIYKSICGLNAEESTCNAKYNWWGSTFGPALFDRNKKDRIFKESSRVLIFPYVNNKIDTAGASWDINYDLYNLEYNSSRYSEIELSGQDSDNDLVPDWWETKWNYDPLIWDDHKNLDSDSDGLNNIEECFTDKWDSNPFKKDIFLEFDWVQAIDPINAPNKPSSDYIEEMISVFEKHDIKLHVDIGNLDGGEEIPFIVDFSFSDLRDLYWDYFLHNDLNNPRKGIFHYCLVCDYGPGSGFAFIGWDNLDSFQIAAEIAQERNPNFDRQRLIMGGVIHELGHTLGLTVDDHGGNDNLIASKIFTLQWWSYVNYRSCMNYWHTFRIIDFSDGTHGFGDFNDWEHMDFSFFKNTHFIKP